MCDLLLCFALKHDSNYVADVAAERDDAAAGDIGQQQQPQRRRQCQDGLVAAASDCGQTHA